MFAALAASAAVLFTPPQDPEPYENRWFCGASAEAWNGASASIMVVVAADGSRFRETSTWTPPRTGETRPRDVHLDAPTLAFHYDQPFQAPLETPSDILVTLTSDGGPETILVGLNLLLIIEDDAPIVGHNPFHWAESAELDPHTLGGLTRRSVAVGFERDGLLARLASARSARLIMVDADGQSLAETQYDLSGTAQRDQLFEEARIKATESLRTPRACDPGFGNTEAFPPEGS